MQNIVPDRRVSMKQNLQKSKVYHICVVQPNGKTTPVATYTGAELIEGYGVKTWPEVFRIPGLFELSRTYRVYTQLRKNDPEPTAVWEQVASPTLPAAPGAELPADSGHPGHPGQPAIIFPPGYGRQAPTNMKEVTGLADTMSRYFGGMLGDQLAGKDNTIQSLMAEITVLREEIAELQLAVVTLEKEKSELQTKLQFEQLKAENEARISRKLASLEEKHSSGLGDLAGLAQMIIGQISANRAQQPQMPAPTAPPAESQAWQTPPMPPTQTNNGAS